VDLEGFEKAMDRQRDQARAAGRFKTTGGVSYNGQETVFRGHDELQVPAKITGLYVDGSAVDRVGAGQQAIVVLDETPFYAESGGQVGDAGTLVMDGDAGEFRVDDTQKIQPNVFGHHGAVIKGSLTVGDALIAQVNTVRRAKIVRNHSATHLMHKALREVLGGHVQQRGSLVDADKTRFDFSHDAAMTASQLTQVEEIVNQEILSNMQTQSQVMAFDDAIKHGAMALFGEKYGDEVRVLDIGSSKELCGGTHVRRTGDIGLFKMVSESGVAAGVRRVEAITGDNVLHWAQQLDATATRIAGLVKSTVADAADRVAQLQEQLRTTERTLEQTQSKLNAGAGAALADHAVVTQAGWRLLVKQVEGVDPKALRGMADQLKDKLGSAVVVLATVAQDKISLVAGVTADLTGSIKAGDLLAHVASQVGGKGGGRADMAMGGGTDVSQLPAALASVATWLDQKEGA
jgi:alanyl-tRNA synthetase